jgi:hypothetical protein
MATAARRTPRTPQDRKPKAVDGKFFSFTHKGKEYTFPKPFAVVRTPKFQRAHRRRDPIDLTYTMIEELAGDDSTILDAIDDMTEAQFADLSNRMGTALQSSVNNPDAVGESEGS